MGLDLIAVSILAIFAVVGAVRGVVVSATGVAVLAMSYVAGLWSAQALGSAVGSGLGLPELLAAPVAGSLGFGLAFVLGGALGLVLRSWDRRRLGDLPRGSGDRIGGALFGVLRGGLIVLLLSWLALWADAARQLSDGERFAAAPSTSGSLAAAATGRVVESAVAVALDDAGAGGRVAARLAAHPAEAMLAVKGLVEDRRIRAIQEDRLFWTYVENGAVQSALNRASFYRIVHDEALRGELAELGLIDEAAAADSEAFRAAAADVLTQVGPRLKQIRNDPELQQLARDPEIARLLESGDTFALMRHPGIQRVVSRVSEGL